MSEDKKVRDEVVWFALQMETKLIENDDKIHWSETALSYLLDCLTVEVAELQEALSNLQTVRDTNAAIRECADVANFAMMVADNLNKASVAFKLQEAGDE